MRPIEIIKFMIYGTASLIAYNIYDRIVCAWNDRGYRRRQHFVVKGEI